MKKAWILFFTSLFVQITPLSYTYAGTNTTNQYNLPSLGAIAGAELSPNDEYKLGSSLMHRIRADANYLDDPELHEYLNRIGYQLVSRAQSHTYTFEFFPIRDDSLNAFALPGGFIAIHTGTIIHAQSENELAGVMGHEIGHVTQRHIARMLEQQKNTLPVTIGSILLALLAARVGGNSAADATTAILLGGQAALVQSQLAYSQDAEREADRIGLQIMHSAGFDVNGMSLFFRRLRAGNRYYESAAPAYLSTHPLTTERITDAQNRIQQTKVHQHADSIDFLLIQQRARVLQEKNYDGLIKLEKIMRNEQKRLSGQKAKIHNYALSVLYQKMNQQEKAYQRAQKAYQAFPKNAFVLRQYIRTLYRSSQERAVQEKALYLAKQALTQYPLSSMMAQNYVDLLFDMKKDEELIRFLRSENTAFTSNNPNYHALLARSYERQGKRSQQYFHTGEMYALYGAYEAAVYQLNLAQQANDADFYVMSQIDARLRRMKEKALEEKQRER